MKSLFPTIALCSLLMACSQNNQPPKTDETNTTNQAVSKSPDTQSIYAPYTEEAVKAKLNEMQMIIDNGHVYLPAEVKEAESYINGWNKYPDVLKAMMETDLDPNNTQEAADIPLEDESAQVSDLNVKARISARESQSAFNVQGAIEYILEIQSTNDQPFILQGMSINRGRCGYYTADFHSKMPVQMNYSSTVSYLLKCRGDQVLEAELMTDQGNVSLSF
ncbi:hypothetical protein ABLT95_16540 [Acinetobacter nosocomialis]|uniref:hypothetical protein n=1 Tax=Acinetobacter nosocomialis TaxID=106654 RepID=UPI000DE6A7D5|nr:MULTISPECIES: hypothetical protein [Acinetobacter calcoaceticus/baumannii complex]MBP1516830.1 hypothetical protein [Acinetobacter nosocomialis]QNX31033.1 hypothetical protein IC790_04285 [Acinetobacter seifertii]SSR69868.1 Uncharacterised protein [Acinetobacter baumannii]